MHNFSQNKLNQIEVMRDQSRDELERIAKIIRIIDYEEMSEKRVNNISFKIKTKHNRIL